MKIGILVFSIEFSAAAGTEGLERAAKAAGHEAMVLYEPYLATVDGSLRYQGAELPDLDVIISRPNYIEEPSMHVLTTEALVKAGYRVLNGRDGVTQVKNKLSQHVRLEASGIPMPKWGIVRDPSQVRVVAEEIGFPLMAKIAYGTQGKGVFYAENLPTLLPIVDYLAIRDRNPVILQTFVAEADRKDRRAFVIGGEVFAGMERTAGEGDIRSNIGAGGAAAAVKLTPEEKKLAVEAAAAFGLDIAGVDLLASNRGPLVIEVNANPGYTALEEATGRDVAGAIIAFATAR